MALPNARFRWSSGANVDIDWDNPVLKEVVKSGVNWFYDLFRDRRIAVAFTGMEGVGKTVLYDYLTGKGFLPNYTPPMQSQVREKGDLTAGKARLVVHVVPGQQVSEPRYTALDQVFKGSEPVEGVVHVVAYGHAVIRNESSRNQLITAMKIDNADKFREHQRQREIADLEETCQWILDSHRVRRYPKWMLVVIDKVDLFSNSITEARDYYSPGSGSLFSSVLDSLLTKVGTAFFRWQTVPVCTHLENLTWNKGTIPTRMTPDKRNAYINQFQRLLETYFNQS